MVFLKFTFRYVGPSEGVWIILRKLLQEKSHSIVRLPIPMARNTEEEDGQQNPMMFLGFSLD